MELDDFKTHWNAVHQAEIKHQAHTPETLGYIIENTSSTLGELRTKSSFWKTLGSWNSAMLLVLAIGYGAMLYYKGESPQEITAKLPLLGIIVCFALFSNWAYKRQDEIFSAATGENLKVQIRSTLHTFSRYYRFSNLAFLVLGPMAFYAVIALFFAQLELPLSSILLICAFLTGLSFLVRYVYYRNTYFKRLKSLEANLMELENAL